jgi:predicted metal-dependent phosphoesterase TrpH
VIDLHLHTTASDGRLTPRQLTTAVAAAGIQRFAVTDHDTLAGLEEAEAGSRDVGVPFVRGIEITAVQDGIDVHVLGYFVDQPDADFLTFLADQRADRRRRAREMMDRLAMAGVPVSETLVFADNDDARAVGRPALGRALVAAGHARDVNDAFDRYLGAGRPAFVSRRGPSPGAVVRALTRIGAIAALAHPGKQDRDDLIGPLVAAGMTAIEVFHPDHDVRREDRYRGMAREHGLLATGGSDYHGPDTGRAAALGRVGIDAQTYADLEAHVAERRRG